MSSNKQVRSLAKDIFNSCKKDEILDEAVLKKFVSLLVNSEEPIAKKLLTNLDSLVANEEKRNTLIIESAFELETEQLETIKKYFETKEGRKLKVIFSVNKEIIGGLRLRLGDFVWENSVMSNLATLENIMSYE